MNKRCFVIIAALIALLLTACGPVAGDDPSHTTPSQIQQTTPADETTHTAAVLKSIVDGGSDYVILRADRATDAEVAAAMYLRDKIEEKCGVRLRIVNELDAQPSKAIIVGNVNYGGAADIAAGLGGGDFTVTLSGEHLIICGAAPEQTTLAVEYVIEHYLTDVLAVPEGLNDLLHTQSSSHPEALVTIGGAELGDFSIVTRQTAVWAETQAAQAIQTAAKERFGTELTLKKDNTTASACEIIIGVTTRPTTPGLDAALAALPEGDGLVYIEGTKVYITGKDTDGVCRAAQLFAGQQLSTDNIIDGTLALSEGSYAVATSETEFTVMSFNVLVAKSVEQDRFDAAMTQIKQADPDLLGVQECSTFWYDYLCRQLGDEYGVVGELNSSTQQWRNAIFYRKARFELVETKTQWLSATPSAMSMLTNENQYRILTYAVLKDIKTGATFAHCNTHMTIIEAVREYQFNVLVKLLDRIGYPIVLTGDFNTREGSEYYSKITAAGLQSAHNMTADNDPAHTCGSGVIDFCFVDPEHFGVVSHQVLEETVGGVEPSDHNAVVVKVRLNN